MKKQISLLLTFSIFFAMFTTISNAGATPTYKNLPNFIAPIEVIDPDDPEYADWIPISDRIGLSQVINNNLSGKYYLTNDIDLSDGEWERSIGRTYYEGPFTGTFDGQGYVIRNMTITHLRAWVLPAGLFGQIGRAHV